jgi:hypothetical protein
MAANCGCGCGRLPLIVDIKPPVFGKNRGFLFVIRPPLAYNLSKSPFIRDDLVIVETAVFTKQVQKILSDDEYRQLQIDLANQPASGPVIRGSGGLRKIRWGYRGKGKRGGIRTIYYWAVSEKKLLMLFMFPKNVQGNLSPNQLKALKQIVKDEYP